MLDRPNLLTTPFEKNQINSSDNDSKTYRKKCIGRWKKHLADISLLSGLKHEALQNYQLSLEYLTSVNDPVWIGGGHFFFVFSCIFIFLSRESDRNAI